MPPGSTGGRERHGTAGGVHTGGQHRLGNADIHGPIIQGQGHKRGQGNGSSAQQCRKRIFF